MHFALLSSLGNEAWDRFCLTSRNAWFRHTSTWIQYTLNMRPAGTSADLSFAAVDNGDIAAVVPLIKEAVYGRQGVSEFGFAGWNVPFPALHNEVGERHRDKIVKEVFREVERLASLHEIAYASFEVHPVHSLIDREAFSCNPLPFLGFHDTGIATHIVPLDRDEASLLRSMRKGHKSDITAGLSNGLVAEVFDSNSISDAAFDTYRRIHFNAAKRKTRPDATWDLMKLWIKSGFAVLTIVRSGDREPVAAALSLVYKDIAYYGSAGIEPEHVHDRGVMHVLIWETIKVLRSRGIRWYETGWQQTPTLSQEVPSKKEVAISLFKRGFGGVNVPYYRGEKFYHSEFMNETFRDRIQKLQDEQNHE